MAPTVSTTIMAPEASRIARTFARASGITSPSTASSEASGRAGFAPHSSRECRRIARLSLPVTGFRRSEGRSIQSRAKHTSGATRSTKARMFSSSQASLCQRPRRPSRLLRGLVTRNSNWLGLVVRMHGCTILLRRRGAADHDGAGQHRTTW